MPEVNVNNILYALPEVSTDQENTDKCSPKLTTTYPLGEDQKYMELSDAVMPPFEYLCHQKTVT